MYYKDIYIDNFTMIKFVFRKTEWRRKSSDFKNHKHKHSWKVEILDLKNQD